MYLCQYCTAELESRGELFTMGRYKYESACEWCGENDDLIEVRFEDVEIEEPERSNNGMIYTVNFTMPTEWLGAEYEDERVYDSEDYETEEEMQRDIEEDFSNWVDDILEDLRMSAEWTIESEEE